MKDRRVQRKDCGTDLTEAMRVYMLVKEAGRPGATLRCKNMGFPPPADLQPRIVEVKKKVELPRPKIVTRKGKKYRKTHEIETVKGIYRPLKKKNAEGIWWCPYCRELRRFVKKKDINVDAGNGTMIHVTEPGMYCPMCGVSHRDANVRKWNPIAIKVYYDFEQKAHRAPARTTASRRAARRRKKKDE